MELNFKEKCNEFLKKILTEKYFESCIKTLDNNQYADKYALISDNSIFPEIKSKGFTYIRRIKENDGTENKLKYKRNPIYENQNYLALYELLEECFDPSKIDYTSRIIQETDCDYIVFYRTTVNIIDNINDHQEIVFIFSGELPLWQDNTFLDSLINIAKITLNIEVKREELNFKFFKEIAEQIKLIKY